MRKSVVPLIAATLMLAGCGPSSQTSELSAPAASSPSSAAASAGVPAPAATAVTGTVSLADAAVAPTPQAALELSLVDVTQQPGITVNKQDFNPPKFPQAFRIPFAGSAINGKDLYVLQATMQDNGRTYSTKLQQPVLTHGMPATVNLSLVAQPTSAERMLEAFEQAKAQTGGMTVKSGTTAKIGISTSWQVFSDLHGVEFVIEQINRADGGFTSTEYAYRNSMPWVVVQKQMSSAGAAPTATKRAGWDDNGALVLKDDVEGGKTGTLNGADAKALHQQAEAEYKRFAKH